HQLTDEVVVQNDLDHVLAAPHSHHGLMGASRLDVHLAAVRNVHHRNHAASLPSWSHLSSSLSGRCTYCTSASSAIWLGDTVSPASRSSANSRYSHKSSMVVSGGTSPRRMALSSARSRASTTCSANRSLSLLPGIIASVTPGGRRQPNITHSPFRR